MNPDYQNMWPGGVAGQGDSFPPQWSMSSGTQYNMNVPQEQVDWASLAQQWIRMKEEAPAEKEGGEAPMELTKEEALPNPMPAQVQPWQPGSQPPPPEGNWGSGWGWDQNNTWCWNAAKPPPSGNYPNPQYSTGIITTEPSVPIPPQNVFCYTAPQIPVQPESYSSNSGFWASSSSEPKDNWENSNSKKKETVALDAPPELDAAKRKQLPAWIREGLEKMEREKQKKAESEKMEKLRQEELSKKSEASNSNSNGERHLPPKSKFESDSEENSEPEVVEPAEPRKSRFGLNPSQVASRPVYRTKEQILQACMVDVRKILTQILMEVTSEEIRKAVNETYKKLKKKAPAATIRKTPALSSLTGKLGLGIYESDSGSESEQEKVTDPDSDQDIRDRIERLKNEFVNVEERIGKEVAEQEERERKQLRTDANNDASNNVEEQVQPINKGGAHAKEKHGNPKGKDLEGKREKTERESGKECKKKERRSQSLSSSSSESSSSRTPSPYYKKKHKQPRKRYSSSSRSRSRSASVSRSRSKSRSRDRRHKNKSRSHRSDSRKRYRGRRRSSSTSSGDHRRKSGHRR